METLTVHAPSPSTNLPSYGNGAFSLSAPHVPGAGPLLVQVVYSFFQSAYSALFDHGLASKSDQRFASIRSTGNLTFSTAF
ncbi:lipid II-degrading bacteriocin [Escherichia coli]|nr:lipid II-degrading bacteriocin [Escherichia coli]